MCWAAPLEYREWRAPDRTSIIVAVLVATRRHKGAFERPERMALTAHQFG